MTESQKAKLADMYNQIESCDVLTFIAACNGDATIALLYNAQAQELLEAIRLVEAFYHVN